MAELTKEQLLQQVEELKAQSAAQQEMIQKLSAKGEGWLVTTGNPMFDGPVYSIQFVNGQAFIRKGQEVPFFKVEPMKESKMEKYNIPPAEREAIREREKRPSAERAVDALRDDFGYRVEYFDAAHLMDLQRVIDDRLSQRVQAEAMLAQQIEAEKLTMPGYRR
jgi:hypothetical protein